MTSECITTGRSHNVCVVLCEVADAGGDGILWTLELHQQKKVRQNHAHHLVRTKHIFKSEVGYQTVKFLGRGILGCTPFSKDFPIFV